MSQVDKLNYVPLLVWFVILMVVLYMVVFVHFLPLAFTVVSVRTKFLGVLVAEGFALITLAVQLVNFSSRISVPAVSAVHTDVVAGLPALLYSYIITK